MKKLIVFSLIVFVMTVKSFAQDFENKYTPQERAQMQTGWMKENLQLNEQQLLKVDSLNLKYALKMEEVKSTQGRLNQVKKARSIAEEKDAQLKQILDKTQYETYLEKRKELRHKMQEMRKDQ
ncbi:MAG: hypothetical protein PHS40_12010 [Mariniphaga sp.]|nr:hypothetical protein [Mariniphaga sp.]MDD4426642.1 hypothetical protein [Mariniphaga sp.]